MEVAADAAPAEVGARGFVARVGGKSVADRVRSHKGIAAKAAPTEARLGNGWGPSTSALRAAACPELDEGLRANGYMAGPLHKRIAVKSVALGAEKRG